MKLWHMIVIYSFLLGKTGISQSGYEDLIIIVTDLLVVQFDVLPGGGGGRGRGEREKRGVNLYSPDTNHDVISYDSIFDYKS